MEIKELKDSTHATRKRGGVFLISSSNTSITLGVGGSSTPMLFSAHYCRPNFSLAFLWDGLEKAYL